MDAKGEGCIQCGHFSTKFYYLSVKDFGDLEIVNRPGVRGTVEKAENKAHQILKMK